MTILFCVTSTVIFSQDINYTNGFPNGRYWTKATRESKVFYLMGLRDAFSISQVFLSVKKDLSETGTLLNKNYSATNYSEFELTKVIDSIYSKIEYLVLPLRDVASIILEKYSGKISDEIMKINLEKCLKVYVK